MAWVQRTADESFLTEHVDPAWFEADAPYGIVREQPGAQPAVIHYQVPALGAASLPFAVLQDLAPE